MAKLDSKNRDYIIKTLAEKFSVELLQAILLRLTTHRGKYWRNPLLGSRFYLLHRSKDVPRNLQLAKQYAEEALADLVPNRVQSIDIQSYQTEKSRIDLSIEITLLTGQKQSILYFVPVGG